MLTFILSVLLTVIVNAATKLPVAPVLKVPLNARLVPMPVSSAVPVNVVPPKAPLPRTVIVVLIVAAVAADIPAWPRPGLQIFGS